MRITNHFHVNGFALSLALLRGFYFSFLLGITVVPREIEENSYAKFWGANKVYYGDVQIANGLLHAEEAKSNHG